MVAIRFHHNCFVYRQFGRVSHCFSSRNASWVTGRPFQTIQNPVFSTKWIQHYDILWQNGLHWGEILSDLERHVAERFNGWVWAVKISRLGLSSQVLKVETIWFPFGFPAHYLMAIVLFFFWISAITGPPHFFFTIMDHEKIITFYFCIPVFLFRYIFIGTQIKNNFWNLVSPFWENLSFLLWLT